MRRLGSTPQQRGSVTGETCPDVIERDNGDLVIVGKIAHLFHDEWLQLKELGVSMGEGEGMVIIPRQVLVDAKKDIPDA